jgi:hypothetical protein
MMKEQRTKRGLIIAAIAGLDNGKLELHEEWQWLNGDKSTGSSVVVEQ